MHPSIHPDPPVDHSSQLASNAGLSSDGRALTIANMLWLNRRFLARMLFIGLISSTIIAFSIPKRYEATARLMPPDPQGSSVLPLLLGGLGAGSATGGSAGLQGLAGDLLGVKGSGALFIGVLHSQTIQDRLVERFRLREVYHSRYAVDARESLDANTFAFEDRKSGIIEIKVRDRDPQRARALAEAYVQELNTVIATVSTSSARRERMFLEDRLKVVKSELDDAAKQFSDFASKNSALDIPQQGKAIMESVAKAQGQLIAVESQQRGLEQIYSENNVRVRSARAQVAELKRQISKLGGATPEDNEGQAGFVLPSLRQLPLLGVKYADLYRRAKVEEAVYEFLTKQYEAAKVQEAKEIPTVRILDTPTIPERKAFPPRLVIMFVGTFFACCLAAAFVISRDKWERASNENSWKELALDVLRVTRSNGDSRVWNSLRFIGRSRGNGYRSDSHESAVPPNRTGDS